MLPAWEKPPCPSSLSNPSTITPPARAGARTRRTHADAVDRGERSPFENLREIAKDGLITLGRDGGSLVPQVSVASTLPPRTPPAFSLCSPLDHPFFDAVGRELPAGLADATVGGTTAMAAAYKGGFWVWHRQGGGYPSLRAV